MTVCTPMGAGRVSVIRRVCLGIFLAAQLHAHSGRTDSLGGHTGPDGYHVHDPAENASYVRSDWPHWIDGDKDCEDVRTEILKATSRSPVSIVQCVVVSGSWLDPYTDTLISSPAQLDIDHIVPLSWASRRGGLLWTRERKTKFANDLENLQAVSSAINRQKGARIPPAWLPPNRAYWCEYQKRFQAVITKYQLAPLEEELHTLQPCLSVCTNP